MPTGSGYTDLSPQDQTALEAAFEQALRSREAGGVPIGAALVDREGNILAAGHNERVQTGDTTAHAEMVCLRNAGRGHRWHELTMATTLSPCVMCTGAALLHRIPRIVIGESDTFLGAEDLLESNGVTLIRANDQRCVDLMRAFIADRPDLWNEDIGVPSEK